MTWFGTTCWVGYLGTAPNWRREGVGTKILRFLMNDARTRGYRTIELFATPMGRPIYDREGFLPTNLASLYYVTSRKSNPPPDVYSVGELPRWAVQLDKQAYGGDRSALFQYITAEGGSIYLVDNQGFCFVDKDGSAGPMVAKNQVTALKLSQKIVSAGGAKFLLPSYVPDQLANSLSLEPIKGRTCLGMVYGEERRCRNDLIYGLHSFAMG